MAADLFLFSRAVKGIDYTTTTRAKPMVRHVVAPYAATVFFALASYDIHPGWRSANARTMRAFSFAVAWLFADFERRFFSRGLCVVGYEVEGKASTA